MPATDKPQLNRGPIWLRKAIAQMGDHVKANAPVSSHEVEVVSTPKGKVLFTPGQKAGAATSNSNRSLRVLSTGQIMQGTVLGEMPVIGTTPLDDPTPPTLTIPGSGTKYVVLVILGTPVTTPLSGRVFFHPAMNDIGVSFALHDTAPTGADLIGSDGLFQIHWATFVDGVKTFQEKFGPVTGYVQDQLDGSGNGLLIPTYH